MEEQVEYIASNKNYCSNYDSTNLACIRCIEQAIFKVKACYKAGKGGL